MCLTILPLNTQSTSVYFITVIWLLIIIIWWVTGKVQPDRAHPSPGRTGGRWVHRGTLLPIWPLSWNYEDIRPVTPCWHQLFHPWLGVSWRAGTSYSFQYKSKRPAHCQHTSKEKYPIKMHCEKIVYLLCWYMWHTSMKVYTQKDSSRNLVFMASHMRTFVFGLRVHLMSPVCHMRICLFVY